MMTNLRNRIHVSVQKCAQNAGSNVLKCNYLVIKVYIVFWLSVHVSAMEETAQCKTFVNECK